MVNVLLSYDKNYQSYVFPVINSLLQNTPGVTIFIIVTPDVTLKVKHPQVKYFVNDPKENFGKYSATKHLVGTKAPYNFIHGLNILKNEVNRVIISGVDTVHTKNLTELFNFSVSTKGFAGMLAHAKVLNMIKGFSNIPITPQIISKYAKMQAFATANAVVDLKLFHKNQGYQVITNIFEKYDTSEMLAMNLYLKGNGEIIPDCWVTCHRVKKQNVYSVDWRGAKKPWNNQKLNYLELWNFYNKVLPVF